MSKETCTVLCKLPNGLICETGYHIDPTTCGMVKQPNYARIVLNGWNQNVVELAQKAGMLPVNPIAPGPGVTHNVPREAMEQWCKEHPKFAKRYIEIVRNAADEAAASKDLTQLCTGLEAMNPDGDARYKTGATDKIERADFAKDRLP